MWSDGQKGEEAGSQVIFLLSFLVKIKKNTVNEQLVTWVIPKEAVGFLDNGVYFQAEMCCTKCEVLGWLYLKDILGEVSQSQEWCTIAILLLTNIIQKHDQCYFCPMSRREYQLKVIHIIQSPLRQLVQLLSPQPSLKNAAGTGWKLYSMVRSSDGFLRSGEPMPP